MEKFKTLLLTVVFDGTRECTTQEQADQISTELDNAANVTGYVGWCSVFPKPPGGSFTFDLFIAAKPEMDEKWLTEGDGYLVSGALMATVPSIKEVEVMGVWNLAKASRS